MISSKMALTAKICNKINPEMVQTLKKNENFLLSNNHLTSEYNLTGISWICLCFAKGGNGKDGTGMGNIEVIKPFRQIMP